MTTKRKRHSHLLAWVVSPLLLGLGALLFADQLYNPQRFRIDSVQVRGAPAELSDARIADAAWRVIRGNFFALNLAEVEAEVEALPGVFSAAVRRRWPGRLVVHITAVQPVALWGDAGVLHKTGDLVARGGGRLPGEMPRLDGPDGSHKRVWRAYQRWTPLLASVGLQLPQLHRDARGLWRLQVDTGADENLPLVLSERDADRRIAQFIGALRLHLSDDLAAMQSVDLRHPNGFAVNWLPVAADESATPALSHNATQ